MADRNAFRAVLIGEGEEPRDIAVIQVRRQPRVDAGNVAGHAVKEVGLDGAEQRIEDRLVDFRRTISGGERRNVLFCTSSDLVTNTRCMQIERGLEAAPCQIEPACDLKRPPQTVDRLRRRQLWPLVEPLWHQQLGAGADRGAPAFDLDLSPHEQLRRRVDRHRAEA